MVCGPAARLLFLTSFLVPPPPSLPVGNVAQLQLPATMQHLNLGATGVTGMFAMSPRFALRPARQNKV